MLSHADVWRGVDRLAEVNGLSPSGLARRAGLDPTTFNKSKRTTRDGRPRWPSTESLAKILGATQTSFGEFVGLVHPQTTVTAAATIPMVELSNLSPDHFDPAGFLTERSRRFDAGGIAAPHLYAVAIDTAAYEPTFRRDATILVNPALSARRFDRVIAMTGDGSTLIGVVAKRGQGRLQLSSVVGDGPLGAYDAGELAWLARIVWASQ